MNYIEAYLRQAARIRGIDENAVVALAKAEGGLTDPVRQSLGSQHGVREQSYGPLQLNIAPGAMGARAIAAGIDPRKPEQWQQAVDFALNEAARTGNWKAWAGRHNAGIGDFGGLGGAKPVGITLTSTPTPSGVYTVDESGGGGGGGDGNVATFDPNASFPNQPKLSMLDRIKNLFTDKGEDGKGETGMDALTTMVKDKAKADAEMAQSAGEIAPSSIGASDDSARFQAAQQLMATLMAKRRGLGGVPGMSLTGMG
jgi:hypothetical protein